MDGVRTSHMGDVIQDVYRGIDAYRVSDEGEVERIDDKLQKLIMGPMDCKEEIVELSRANLELLKDPYVVGAAAPSTLIHYIYFDEEGHAFYAPLESNFMFNPSNMFKVDERLRVFYQSDGGYLTNTVLVGVITWTFVYERYFWRHWIYFCQLQLVRFRSQFRFTQFL